MEAIGSGKVHYQVHGGVAELRLHNPPANTYSFEMMRDLDEAILRARFAEEVHVILLTTTGEKFFCAGADIAMLGDVTTTFKYNFCLHANETLLRLEHTSKLVIAAIEGHCVGGGLEVALAADLRIAARDSGKMGLPEVKLGVLPGTGGTQRLARAIGAAKAIELMASGELFSFEEAKSLGLLSAVLDQDDFVDAARTYAQNFCPPHKASKAVGHIKRAVQTGTDLSLADGLALERELQQRLFESSDAAEGIAAYNEKRQPVFKGR